MPLPIRASGSGVLGEGLKRRVADPRQRSGRTALPSARDLLDIRTALPIRRNGTAEDAAYAITALADNGFITGVVLPCDGGLRLT